VGPAETNKNVLHVRGSTNGLGYGFSENWIYLVTKARVALLSAARGQNLSHVCRADVMKIEEIRMCLAFCLVWIPTVARTITTVFFACWRCSGNF
jgi:hypothetical protein